MSIQNDYLQQVLYSIDQDLLFFSTDEHRHLGIIDEKGQYQLEKSIKRAHQQIQHIKKHKRHGIIGTSGFSLHSTTENRYSSAHQQQMTIAHDFFQQKHTQRLYLQLKDIKNQYHKIIRDQRIRILENDMERYQQLQKIHSISSRLDVYDQVYDELYHLRRALASIRRNWKLDRIQQIVNTIVASSTSPSSSSSPLPSLYSIAGHQKQYTSTTNNVFSFLKRWSKHHHSSSATITTTKTSNHNQQLQNHHHHHQQQQQHQHQDSHPHLLCKDQQQGRNIIIQIIQDFQHVFEENVHQNEQRMYQLYSQVFQQHVDPMLAHDIQRLYLSVLATSPPSLTSLTPSGISSVCSWTSDITGALFFNTNHQAPIDFDAMIHRTGSLSPSPSPSKRRKKGIKWISYMWNKKKQHQQRQKQTEHLITTSCHRYYFYQQPENRADGPIQQQQQKQQQKQVWSVCLALLSRHLLYVGQQYYTQWIQEISQCQENQIAPFQLATETVVSTYRALQIEHGYSILSRLCLQMESFGL